MSFAPVSQGNTLQFPITNRIYSTGSRYEECYAGMQADEPFTTPPDGRLRRNKGSREEEISGPHSDGFIDEDLRVGGPYLCRIPAHYIALPKTHSHYQRLVAENQEVKDHVSRILEAARITPTIVEFIGRLSEVEQEASPVLTLLVIALRERLDPAWLDTARILWNYLRAEGFTNMNVEIVDLNMLKRLEVSESGLEENVSHYIGEMVEEEIRDGVYWRYITSIAVFRLGWSTNHVENPVTLTITIEPDAPLREQVVSILNSKELSFVAVMIIRGDIPSLTYLSSPTPDRWEDF
ncbi:hypothetical protein BJY01DRAFT_248732 [Aspergillus pseudoustus]|uniref:Uncharacterized protein n=1 Tax=Aspergillus pseudoustus TaxID=1810923 RepID=A0ABR4JW53_9EURO